MIRAMLAELSRDEKKDSANTCLEQLLSNILIANSVAHEELRVLMDLLDAYEASCHPGSASEDCLLRQEAERLSEDIREKDESEDKRLRYRERLLEEQTLNIRQLLLYRSSRARSLRRYLKELEREKCRDNAPAKTIGR